MVGVRRLPPSRRLPSNPLRLPRRRPIWPGTCSHARPGPHPEAARRPAPFQETSRGPIGRQTLAPASRSCGERPGWVDPVAFGVGVATISRRGDGTEGARHSVSRAVNLGREPRFAAVVADVAGQRRPSGGFRLDRRSITAVLAELAPLTGDGGDASPTPTCPGAAREHRAAAGTGDRGRPVVTVTFIESLDAARRRPRRLPAAPPAVARGGSVPTAPTSTGMFGLLNNVVWTNARPVRPRRLRIQPRPPAARATCVSPCSASTSSRG